VQNLDKIQGKYQYAHKNLPYIIKNNVNEGTRSRLVDCIGKNGDKTQCQGVVPSISAVPLDIGLQRVRSHSCAK
jgi:hypothetical protein